MSIAALFVPLITIAALPPDKLVISDGSSCVVTVGEPLSVTTDGEEVLLDSLVDGSTLNLGNGGSYVVTVPSLRSLIVRDGSNVVVSGLNAGYADVKLSDGSNAVLDGRVDYLHLKCANGSNLVAHDMRLRNVHGWLSDGSNLVVRGSSTGAYFTARDGSNIAAHLSSVVHVKTDSLDGSNVIVRNE